MVRWIYAHACLVVFVLALTTTTHAHARSGIVTLTNGDVATVEVVAMALGQQVTVQLTDGAQKVLPWHWIVSVELAAPVALQPPAGTLVPSPAIVAAAAAPVAAAAQRSRALALQAEIDALNASRPTIGWPIALMGASFGVGASALLVAATLEDEETYNYSTGDYEYKSPEEAEQFYIIGGVSAALGIGGLIWLVSNLGTRSEIGKKRAPRLDELRQLQFGVAPTAQGAAATVRWSL